MTGISKTESILVGVLLGAACPLLTSVLLWWTTAAAGMYVLHVPERVIATAALTGLAIGVGLDVVFLRSWTRRFYSANVWLLVALYVALCPVAVAFCMGLPLGTFALGIVAGAYAGRRARHLKCVGAPGRAFVRKAALLAACVTTAAALPIGLLALREESVIGLLGMVCDLVGPGFRGIAGLALVGVLSVLLFVVQYWCAQRVGQAALSAGDRVAGPTA